MINSTHNKFSKKAGHFNDSSQLFPECSVGCILNYVRRLKKFSLQKPRGVVLISRSFTKIKLEFIQESSCAPARIVSQVIVSVPKFTHFKT
jgi:hypothetical protein